MKEYEEKVGKMEKTIVDQGKEIVELQDKVKTLMGEINTLVVLQIHALMYTKKSCNSCHHFCNIALNLSMKKAWVVVAREAFLLSNLSNTVNIVNLVVELLEKKKFSCYNYSMVKSPFITKTWMGNVFYQKEFCQGKIRTNQEN